MVTDVIWEIATKVPKKSARRLFGHDVESEGCNLQIGHVLTSLDVPAPSERPQQALPDLPQKAARSSNAKASSAEPSTGTEPQTYNWTGFAKEIIGSGINNPSTKRRTKANDWRPSRCLPASSRKRACSPSGRTFTAVSASACVMNSWMASFDADRAHFQSVAVMCEQRLRKVCVVTAHATMPDEFRTMAACEALGTLLPMFDRYNSLVVLILREILRSVYEDADLVTDHLLAWIHPENSQQPTLAPAEAMLLKSTPYFVRCRQLQSEIADLQRKMLEKEEHAGTLLNNLTSARNSMRAILGKDSLLITRFIFTNWKCVVENGLTLRRRFQRVRLRIWFGGLRMRLVKSVEKEIKYQLGLRERELTLHRQGDRHSGCVGKADGSQPPPPQDPPQENARNRGKAATTRELIAASLVEQAQAFLSEVQQEGVGKGTGAIIASMTRLVAAVRRAEGQIRLDVGNDLSAVEDDEDATLAKSTTGTQTDVTSNRSDTKMSPEEGKHLAAGSMHVKSDDPARNGTVTQEQDSKMVGGTNQGLPTAPGERSLGLNREESSRDRICACLKLSRFALQAISIPNIYAKKMVADASDDSRGASRAEPVKAIEAFVFENCNGDAHMSQLKFDSLKAAVQKYGSSGNGRIGLFGAMVGWVHEKSYTPQAMDLYLAVISGIFNDRSPQMHARMIRGEGHAYMPLETVARVIEKLLPIMDEGEHFQHRSRVLSCRDAYSSSSTTAWALSDARKMDLTRGLLSMARTAGDVFVGSTTYAESFSVDPIAQVVDIDATLERVMRAWFDQRHECRRQLVKTIETHRVVEIGERLNFSRFCDMVWAISGLAISMPAARQLFGITALSDSQKGNVFLFRQAGLLAEHMLRMISFVSPDKERALIVLQEGHNRVLRDKAQQEWQEISMKSTRKRNGDRLRLYIAMQARIRGWKIRWTNAMALRIQQLFRGYTVRRRGGRRLGR